MLECGSFYIFYNVIMWTIELPKREIKFRYFNHWTMEFYSYEDNSMWALHEIADYYNLMQYTWLKDKEWKYIYEWDIVTYPNKTIEKFWKYVVKNLLDFWYFILHYNLIKELEVIWNVFENPELL